MKNDTWIPAKTLSERMQPLIEREPDLAVPRLRYDGHGGYSEERGLNNLVAISDDYANMLHEIVMVRWLGQISKPDYMQPSPCGQGLKLDQGWNVRIGATGLSRGASTLVESLIECCEYALNEIGVRCPACGEKINTTPRCTADKCCKED